ncbi:MAG: hypothetical protein CM1200mP41_12040 [Gammaproteobacteria bacterium]|nr:MAG: hypothetical protein CM1200mP41_12040 [Gammaproteobacteria bacterium]
MVRVKTRKGWVVLASDVSHFYENYQARSPFPIVYNVADMLKGFERLETPFRKGGIVLPGHDPLVLTRFPAANESSGGIVVRVDAD